MPTTPSRETLQKNSRLTRNISDFTEPSCSQFSVSSKKNQQTSERSAGHQTARVNRSEKADQRASKSKTKPSESATRSSSEKSKPKAQAVPCSSRKGAAIVIEPSQSIIKEMPFEESPKYQSIRGIDSNSIAMFKSGKRLASEQSPDLPPAETKDKRTVMNQNVKPNIFLRSTVRARNAVKKQVISLQPVSKRDRAASASNTGVRTATRQESGSVNRKKWDIVEP